MAIYEKYPLLLPESTALTVYSGDIVVDDCLYGVRISQGASANGWSDGVLECDPSLTLLLAGSEALIKERLHQSNTLVSFLDELCDLIHRQQLARPKSLTKNTKPTLDYNVSLQILSEVDTLGWSKVTDVGPSLQWLTFTVASTDGVQHNLRIEFSKQYPMEAPICFSDLPDEFAPRWDTSAGGIANIYDQFLDTLQHFQPFWDQVREFDTRTWVLDPQQPRPSDRIRRVVIETNTSVEISINPHFPTALPECRFLGPDHVVKPLRKQFSKSVYTWSDSKSVIDNIESILSIKFLLKCDAPADLEFNVECGVCYTYKLDGAIPDKVCDDKRCARSFHQSCLYEWVRTLPSSRQSFGTIFGECPYCATPITVKLQES